MSRQTFTCARCLKPVKGSSRYCEDHLEKREPLADRIQAALTPNKILTDWGIARAIYPGFPNKNRAGNGARVSNIRRTCQGDQRFLCLSDGNHFSLRAKERQTEPYCRKCGDVVVPNEKAGPLAYICESCGTPVINPHLRTVK